MKELFLNPSFAWVLVVGATIVETVWFLALKKWGNDYPWNIALYGLVVISITLLTFALRHLPAGTVYAFWTGASAVAIAILGVYLYGESTSMVRLMFIAIAIVGVIGIQLTSK